LKRISGGNTRSADSGAIPDGRLAAAPATSAGAGHCCDLFAWQHPHFFASRGYFAMINGGWIQSFLL